MKNQKQCGYLDSKGGFHKTILECNNSNLEYRVRILKDKIGNLNMSYSRRFREKYNFHSKTELVERVILELLVNQRVQLLEYSNEIAKLREEISNLENTRKLPKIFRKDWWKIEIISF